MRRANGWRARGEEKLADLSGRLPTLDRIVRRALAPATIDRCFVLAAQILTTAIPMLVAVSAFAPQFVRERLVQTVTQVFGIEGGDRTEINHLINGSSQVRQEVGVIGLLFALMSMTSLTRRLQRLYEECWAVPPGRRSASTGPWIMWIAVWISTLAVQGPLRAGHGFWLVAGWACSTVMAVLLWWWTPHLLLLRRVGWRDLAPTALITGGAATVLGMGSRIVMPRSNRHAIEEYGPYGIILTLISWLLVQAGVIVIGAAAGQIIATRHDPVTAEAAAPHNRFSGGA